MCTVSALQNYYRSPTLINIGRLADDPMFEQLQLCLHQPFNTHTNWKLRIASLQQTFQKKIHCLRISEHAHISENIRCSCYAHNIVTMSRRSRTSQIGNRRKHCKLSKISRNNSQHWGLKCCIMVEEITKRGLDNTMWTLSTVGSEKNRWLTTTFRAVALIVFRSRTHFINAQSLCVLFHARLTKGTRNAFTDICVGRKINRIQKLDQTFENTYVTGTPTVWHNAFELQYIS